ncbi:hypothetical protein [Winslowiella iniecta]|uniref:Uncharacterized protein n=1 Tax=Winslowiella iniecta TaxID=1560201 RepID=A0A0L7SXD7_9GAMM|nr:hypothetical protein [Winslowiella iniecta]KOC87783.1 hypothetical protein NG42_18965 [Winslowiella iniecta]KOC90043.1 hypothetical protein NG43_17790 [Winslowiella iniecta]
MPDSRLTLSTLLSLKKRRERRIRREITRLDREGDELNQRKQQLLQAHQQLWQQWRESSGQEQTLTPQQWKLYRAQLAGYYQQDHALQSQVAVTDNMFSRLQMEKDDQHLLLRQVLMEQEKLNILME